MAPRRICVLQPSPSKRATVSKTATPEALATGSRHIGGAIRQYFSLLRAGLRSRNPKDTSAALLHGLLLKAKKISLLGPKVTRTPPPLRIVFQISVTRFTYYYLIKSQSHTVIRQSHDRAYGYGLYGYGYARKISS